MFLDIVTKSNFAVMYSREFLDGIKTLLGYIPLAGGGAVRHRYYGTKSKSKTLKRLWPNNRFLLAVWLPASAVFQYIAYCVSFE